MVQHSAAPDVRLWSSLLDIRQIYHEPNVPESSRGRAILERFPHAERLVVPSHWNIPELHRNERWHPHAEEWLWHPEVQEAKISGGGGHNLRYRLDLERPLVAEFCALLARKLPYCRVRYAF